MISVPIYQHPLHYLWQKQNTMKHCLATMALAHIKMLLGDLVGEEIKEATPVLLDNRSAVDMGKFFKETKHSKHIQRRYHYVREGHINGHHILIWIPKELQLSNIGTKAVTKKDLQDRLKYVVVEASTIIIKLLYFNS